MRTGLRISKGFKPILVVSLKPTINQSPRSVYEIDWQSQLPSAAGSLSRKYIYLIATFLSPFRGCRPRTKFRTAFNEIFAQPYDRPALAWREVDVHATRVWPTAPCYSPLMKTRLPPPCYRQTAICPGTVDVVGARRGAAPPCHPHRSYTLRFYAPLTSTESRFTES
ncbi:hypothetical protein J6590_049105 [Homalodisca vitripennis]|nr:hypothetical protein J6590_049105 [Homalodisca vitripennis]